MRFRYQDEEGAADPVYAKASTIEKAREKLASRWADYIGDLNTRTDGKYAAYVQFKPELVRPVGSKKTRYGPRPDCCDKIQQDNEMHHGPLVHLDVDYSFLPSDNPKQKTPRAPRWLMGGAGIKHCPFCGTKLPKVEVDTDPPQPLCVVTDGGYYCDTCKERLNACECNHPAAAYRIKR